MYLAFAPSGSSDERRGRASPEAQRVVVGVEPMRLTQADRAGLYSALQAVGVPADDLDKVLPKQCPPGSQARGEPGARYCQRPCPPALTPPGGGARVRTPEIQRCLQDGDDSWWRSTPWAAERAEVPAELQDVARAYLDAQAERAEVEQAAKKKLALLEEAVAAAEAIDVLTLELENEEAADELLTTLDELRAIADDGEAALAPVRARIDALRARLESMREQPRSAALAGLGSKLSSEAKRAKKRVVSEVERAAARARDEAQRAAARVQDELKRAFERTAGKAAQYAQDLRKHYGAELAEFRKHIDQEAADIMARVALDANRSKILSAFHAKELKFATEMAALAQRHKEDGQELRLKIARIQEKHKGEAWVRVMPRIRETIASAVATLFIGPIGGLLRAGEQLVEGTLDIHQAVAAAQAAKHEAHQVYAAEAAKLDEEAKALEAEIAALEAEIAALESAQAARTTPAPDAAPNWAANAATPQHPSTHGRPVSRPAAAAPPASPPPSAAESRPAVPMAAPARAASVPEAVPSFVQALFAPAPSAAQPPSEPTWVTGTDPATGQAYRAAPPAQPALVVHGAADGPPARPANPIWSWLEAFWR